MNRANQYQAFLAEDFASDPEFIGWVLNPDEENTELWQYWLSANPEKAKEVEVAVQLIRFAIPQYYHAKDGVQQQIWENILLNVKTVNSIKVSPLHRSAPLWKNWKQWAAVLTGLLFLAGMAYKVIENSKTTKYATGPTETKRIQLPDGSEVILNANSFLSYHKIWDKDNERNVNLRGEAFFGRTSK